MKDKYYIYNSKIKFLLFLALSLLTINIIVDNKTNAIVNNSAGIPIGRQAWNRASTSAEGNHHCVNPSEPSIVFPYQFQTWWSRSNDSANEIPTNSVITVPSGTNAVGIQLNMLGNHCISNMVDNPPPGVPGSPRPGYTSQLQPQIASEFAQLTTFNMYGTALGGQPPGVTITGEANTNKVVDWSVTYLPSYGSYDNRFYVPPINYQATVSGFNALAPGDYYMSVFIGGRAVNHFGTSTSNIVRYRCVSAPRNIVSGPGGTSPTLCNSGGYQIFITFRKQPPPTISCSPANSTVLTNTDSTFTVGGTVTGTASWNAGAFSSPQTSTGTSFTTRWSTSGDRSVTVTRGGISATCLVRVNDPPPPPPVVAPTCSVGPVGNNLGEEITFSVNVINNDSTRNITITQANWSSTGGTTPLNGTGAPLGLVSPGGNSTITSGNVTLNAIGTFQFNWTINISSPTGTFTLTGDDCGTAAARTFSPASSPYSRVYGGDVFAGGGIRTANGSCTPNAGADALGFMKGNSNATFAGTGTDLAVFAADLITGVQSRSMSQLSPAYLAFSNQFSVNIPSYSFGGGFNTTNACTRDYYADRSGTALPSVGTINISNLASGSYTVGNGGTIFLTSPSLPNARRVVVYVNGDAYLQPQGPGNKFGYLNNEWADRSQVPSIYIIASGSIFIDGDITQLDGVFIAQPTAASPNTTGEISTCAKNSGAGRELSNFTTPSVVDHLKANCTRKLTVNGAFIAKQVHLLRHLASVSQAVNSEPSSSPNISEVFNYSPELFLTQGGGIPRSNRNVQIDSLVALPPVF
jgi:hypothetical protein